MAGDTKGQFIDKNFSKNTVHGVLAYSYLFYFISFLLAFLLDFYFPLKIFSNIYISYVGVLFLVFGTFLIFWAQITSLNFKKDNINKETFSQGPYKYTRGPTHFGLFAVMLGFSIIINAMFIIIFSVISFLVSKFFFLRKEEKILSEKYGEPYLEYKRSLRF